MGDRHRAATADTLNNTILFERGVAGGPSQKENPRNTYAAPARRNQAAICCWCWFSYSVGVSMFRALWRLLVFVPGLDVVMDRTGEFDTCLPPSAVQDLDLHSGPERLDHGIVERSADGSHRRREARFCDLLTEDPRRELGEFNWFVATP